MFNQKRRQLPTAFGEEWQILVLEKKEIVIPHLQCKNCPLIFLKDLENFIISYIHCMAQKLIRILIKLRV